MYLVSCRRTWVVYVCLEACDYKAFVSRMTNRHGHWVCWNRAECQRYLEKSKLVVGGFIMGSVQITTIKREKGNITYSYMVALGNT